MFRGTLWLNGSKEALARKLHDSQLNSGVGIDVEAHKDLFDPAYETIELIFADGIQGKATVGKDSWDSCPHLISVSIGAWARRSGLWEQKLRERSVPVWLEKVDDTTFLVSASP